MISDNVVVIHGVHPTGASNSIYTTGSNTQIHFVDKLKMLQVSTFGQQLPHPAIIGYGPKVSGVIMFDAGPVAVSTFANNTNCTTVTAHCNGWLQLFWHINLPRRMGTGPRCGSQNADIQLGTGRE